jgi:hypothetical protein
MRSDRRIQGPLLRDAPTPGERRAIADTGWYPSVRKENVMADFSFDGKKLRNTRTGQKVGEIDRTRVRAWNAAGFGEIDGKNIRDAHGKKVAEFDGKIVKDDRGKRLATIQEIQAAVEGEAGIELVALWYFFVRK